MAINTSKRFVYRIIHRDNLLDLLTHGLVNRMHENATKDFVIIDDTDVIDWRIIEPVKIRGYGSIGDYIPFYFTPRSIMLFNIITGFRHPKVLKRNKDEIIVIRCLIKELARRPQWFFTDGQALTSKHYNNLVYLDQIGWESIQASVFNKTRNDPDRQRRYQAEFLVFETVPIECIESLTVYDEAMRSWVESLVKSKNLSIAVHIHKSYFFD